MLLLDTAKELFQQGKTVDEVREHLHKIISGDGVENVIRAAQRRVYFINELQRDAQGNYIPCIAVEGETGFYLTDWEWGSDLKFAQECADEMNEKMGISKREAMLVQLGTMRGVK